MSKSNAKKTDTADPAADLTARLKTAILDSGLSVNKVAGEAGVPQQVLQRFVSGERENIRLDTAAKLFAFFGMTVTAPKK